MTLLKEYRKAVETLVKAVDDALGTINVTEYDIANPDSADGSRADDYAAMSRDWAASKMVRGLTAARDEVANLLAAAERLPDLIVWVHGGIYRVFPSSQPGLAALLAHPSFARLGMPVIAYGGVDTGALLVEQMQHDGLTVGMCHGEEVTTTIAAVCAWRDQK